MISQEVIAWFQEEIKKTIADEVGEDCPPALAVSLHDDRGIVWVEGLLYARCASPLDGTEYLIQYSLQRDDGLPQDCPYSVSITILEE
jgi:hypothetical protein